MTAYTPAYYRNRAQEFRLSRKAMGFVGVSGFVPERDRHLHAAYMERLKAEYMIDLCQLPVADPRRMLLSRGNLTSIPNASEVRLIYVEVSDTKVRKICTVLLKELEAVAIAQNALQLIKDAADEEQWIGLSSHAVAHSAMAACLYRELKMELEELGKIQPTEVPK